MNSKLNRYVVTGGNRGFGAEIVRKLSCLPDTEVTIASRNPSDAESFTRQVGPNVKARVLDLRSRDSVAQFACAWDEPLAGLVNNAGVQLLQDTPRTGDGYEETFAVNHLHTLELTQKLLPFMKGGRVVFVGSGTHNPRDLTARAFGFRRAQFRSIKNAAEGINGTKVAFLLGFDRYATSKFLNTVSAIEMARRYQAEETAFFCIDPGLMPGTGLVRTASRWLLFMWNHVLPRLGPLIPGCSTTQASAKVVEWLMRAPLGEVRSGTVYNHKARPAKNVWPVAYDQAIGRAVIDDSIELLNQPSPTE